MAFVRTDAKIIKPNLKVDNKSLLWRAYIKNNSGKDLILTVKWSLIRFDLPENSGDGISLGGDIRRWTITKFKNSLFKFYWAFDVLMRPTLNTDQFTFSEEDTNQLIISTCHSPKIALVTLGVIGNRVVQLPHHVGRFLPDVVFEKLEVRHCRLSSRNRFWLVK